MFECVINISEGQNRPLLAELTGSVGDSLRDLHADAFHNRSVFTLINDAETLFSDVQRLATSALAHLDLRQHQGVHPRFGVLDVIPFVPLDGEVMAGAVALRYEASSWLAEAHAIPCFLYGPDITGSSRTLPDVRKHAFIDLEPDIGPKTVTPAHGASAVGAREILLAWNLWMDNVSIERARTIAAAIRAPYVRALGFEVGDTTQVSCNLLAPHLMGPWEVYQAVQELLNPGESVDHCEVVGLFPQVLLEQTPKAQWSRLDLRPTATITSRL